MKPPTATSPGLAQPHGAPASGTLDAPSAGQPGEPASGQPANSAACLYDIVPSPIGELLLTGTSHTLTGLYMLPNHRRGPSIAPGWRRDAAAFAEATRQLDAYFAGELTEFDLPLAAHGSEFQLQVWAALRTIPYGQTASYGEIARAVGQPDSARAVGAANGRNPISIIVPCHRVIGASGALTGYGGGLERKRRLLALESGAPMLC
jgi:methylated-DNA-[protein]-cysteine S-methyltransferase